MLSPSFSTKPLIVLQQEKWTKKEPCVSLSHEVESVLGSACASAWLFHYYSSALLGLPDQLLVGVGVGDDV